MPSLPLDNLPQLPSVEHASGTRRSPSKDDPVDTSFQDHLDRGRDDERSVHPRADETRDTRAQDDHKSGSADSNRTKNSDLHNEDGDDTSAETEPATPQVANAVQPTVGLSEFIVVVADNTQATAQQNPLAAQTADQNILANAAPAESFSVDGETHVVTELGTHSAEDLVAADKNSDGQAEQGRITSKELPETVEQTHLGTTQGRTSDATETIGHNGGKTNDNPVQNVTEENTEPRVRGPRSPVDKATPQIGDAETAPAGEARKTNEPQRVTIEPTPQSNSVESAPAGDGTPHRAPGPFLSLAGNGEAQATTNPSEQVHQARFLQRVSKAFQVAHERGGPIRLRLHPPELGSLRLEVKVEGNVMVARVEVESTTARSLLLDSLPVLRDRLAQQDIRVDQFDVDLLDRQSSGTSDQRRDPAPDNETAPKDALPNDKRDETTETEDAPRAERRPGDGNLDVVV